MTDLPANVCHPAAPTLTIGDLVDFRAPRIGGPRVAYGTVIALSANYYEGHGEWFQVCWFENAAYVGIFVNDPRTPIGRYSYIHQRMTVLSTPPKQ